MKNKPNLHAEQLLNPEHKVRGSKTHNVCLQNKPNSRSTEPKPQTHFEKTNPICTPTPVSCPDHSLNPIPQNKPNSRITQSRSNFPRCAHPHEKLVPQKHKIQKKHEKNGIFSKKSKKTRKSENIPEKFKKNTPKNKSNLQIKPNSPPNGRPGPSMNQHSTNYEP